MQITAAAAAAVVEDGKESLEIRCLTLSKSATVRLHLQQLVCLCS